MLYDDTIIRIKRLAVVLIIAASLVTCISCRQRKAINQGTWFTDDLKNYQHTVWTPGERIPLPIDKALTIAIEWLNKNHKQANWQLDSITLEKVAYSNSWLYTAEFSINDEEAFDVRLVKVLLSGDVWEPRKKRESQ